MRNYFRSMRNWPVDVVVCYFGAMLLTPADPVSHVLVFLPLLAVWMIVRYFLAMWLAN